VKTNKDRHILSAAQIVLDFAQHAISQQLVEIHFEKWQEYQQLQRENCRVTKTDTVSKIKMAAAAILSLI